MSAPRLLTTPIYHDLPVLADSDHALRTDILAGLELMFSHAMNSRSKNFFIRFDLHLPANLRYPNPERAFAKFQNSYFRNLRNAGLDPYYVWCREQSAGALNPHVHFALLLNGQKTQNIHDHLVEATRFWALALGIKDALGLVNWCTQSAAGGTQENGIMIRQDHDDWQAVYARCFEWASYLAKTATKGNAPRGAREWGCSQV